ncbi:RNA polymerase sigma factor [Ekhidna sp.]|uniref:RNA polymerase sigma factor n=1 Tax=Ekhidna sp. TaxID=2608089 RepID=UPI003BA9F42A
MISQSSKQLIERLNDEEYLSKLYEQMQPGIRHYVTTNSGSITEADDLLQESIIIVYKKALDPKFELSSSLETFIYSIGKRIWLNLLRKRKSENKYLQSLNLAESESVEEIVLNEQRIELYTYHFNKLSQGCRKILSLFFDGNSMKEIAIKLGLASDGYARKRKYECQGKLLTAIKEDPLYTELKHE